MDTNKVYSPHSDSFLLVNEVSRLTGFSLTQLYYYERIGLIVPKRNEGNGYREYSMNNVHSLLLIKDLLKLNFSLNDIKKYFDHYTTSGTIELMNKAIQNIHEQIVELYRIRDSISYRLNAAERAREESRNQQIRLLDLPERGCLMVCEEEVPVADIDSAIMEYMQKHGLDLSILNLTDCYTLDISALNEYNAYRYKNIFLYSPVATYPVNYKLPAGKYVCVTYQGALENSRLYIPGMLRYIREHSLEQIGDPLEFCLIDDYFTEMEREFVIMLQIPVRKINYNKASLKNC